MGKDKKDDDLPKDIQEIIEDIDDRIEKLDDEKKNGG